MERNDADKVMPGHQLITVLEGLGALRTPGAMSAIARMANVPIDAVRRAVRGRSILRGFWNKLNHRFVES